MPADIKPSATTRIQANLLLHFNWVFSIFFLFLLEERWLGSIRAIHAYVTNQVFLSFVRAEILKPKDGTHHGLDGVLTILSLAEDDRRIALEALVGDFEAGANNFAGPFIGGLCQ